MRSKTALAGATHLFGRVADLAQLGQILRAPETRLLTLVGPPGVGKTQLALAVGEQQHGEHQHGEQRDTDRFADGVVFVALAELQDPKQMAPSVCRALGLAEATQGSALDQLKQVVGDRRLLLILDNFEHLLPAASTLQTMLAALPGLTALVTSRTALKLASERIYTVPPLQLPQLSQTASASIEQLAQLASVAMFAERAKRVLPDFELTRDNVRAVAEICVRLDGLPLAIELAAPKCRFLSPAALLQRLEQRLPLLASQDSGLPARQRRLRDALAWSYQQLEPEQRWTFNRLGMFAGGWTAEAAEALCPGLSDLIGTLGALLDNNLIVQRVTQRSVPRFGMLETLREFALEQLTASGEQASLAQLHAAYFLRIARENEFQMLSPRQAEVLDLLDAEHDNFRAALRWALQHDPELALELGGRLYFFWQLRSYCSEGRAWLQQALAQPHGFESDVQKVNQARALYGLGSLTYLLSNYDEAIQAHEQALALRRQLGDTRSQATLLNALGQIADQQGQLERAEQLWEEGYALAAAIDDKPRMTATLSNLGELAYKRGDYALALSRHTDALALARLTGSKYNIALELHENGNVELKLGHVERAGLLQEESLVLAREIGDKNAIASILIGLGDVEMQRSDYAQAEARYAESLAIRREIDNRWGVGVSLANLGRVAFARGDRGRAIALLNEGLVILSALGDDLMVASARQWLAEIESSLADATSAG